MNNFKDKTTEVIQRYYREHSLEDTIQVSKAVLESQTHKDNKCFQAHVHGEINEVLLVCILQEFMKNNPQVAKDWKIYKGIILKDPEDPKLLTEIDVLLVTEKRIFIFECKCYGGDKKIIDKCLLKKQDGTKVDVYKQNHLHAVTLDKNISRFRLKNSVGNPGYQLVLFNFSLGKTEDLRDHKFKLLMPCLNETNVINIVKKLAAETAPTVWNLAGLKQGLDIVEKHSNNNRSKHLAFVQSIHS